MGRPTILNQEVIDRVIEHTLKGISIVSVCALSDISRRVYYQWLERAEKDNEQGVESIHTQFAQSIHAAEA